MDWQTLWSRKHDEAILAVLTGGAVVFVGWFCKKIFARWNRLPASREAASAVPHITQHFSPIINNTVQVPGGSAPASASGTDRSHQTDRNTLAELEALLPEQGGMARLRRQLFWHRFEWTLDSLLQQYLQATSGPHHKFLNAELENLRHSLYTSIADLEDRIHRYSDAYASDPSHREFWRSEAESVEEMDARREQVWQLAEQVCRFYDDLVLTGRRKLHD